MLDFKETILPRLKDIISKDVGKRKVYDKDVAKALGINPLTFATIKKRNTIPFREILDFCAKRNISINWLLYNQLPKTLEDETEKFAKVRYFTDIRASAGGGSLNYETESEILYIDEKIVQKLSNIKNFEYLEAINIVGDSMEPTLKEEDIILIDRTQKDITKSGIFVISTTGGVFVKRLILNTNGYLSLISDNPLYPPETIDSTDIVIIGKVVGVISKLG